MHDGKSETNRVNASEIALSKFPPIVKANDTNAPMPPADDSHLEVHEAGTVTVTLDVLWQRRPESSKTQRRT